MIPMSAVPARLILAAACVLACAASASAGTGQCIVAGRINAERQWAPRMAGVELYTEQGARVTSAGRDALESIRQVRLSRAALLSACDGNQELAAGGTEQVKAPVPAVKAGKALIAVESVSFPKLRVGGELVEIKLVAQPERVVMLTR